MPPLTTISPEHFSAKAWKRNTSFIFASQENSVHIVVEELPHLLPTMLIGFMQSGNTFQLVAITSLQPTTNLYVAPDGRWLGRYIPAALRGYPFRLAKVQGREDSVLCIDEDAGLIVEAGRGESFFDETGAPSQSVQGILDFLSQFERSRLVTQVAVDALQAASLIQPWPINVQDGGQAVAIEGFFRIDHAALNALPDEDFIMLRKIGALPIAYAQQLAIHQFVMLEKLIQLQVQLKAQAAELKKTQTGLEGFNLFKDDGAFKFSL